jgi:predicted LPLAT superfamily acyltransferase
MRLPRIQRSIPIGLRTATAAFSVVNQMEQSMNTSLNLRQNLGDFEDFYDMLGDSHDGLDPDQSAMLNARLVLLLSNHIGDMAVLRDALALARVQIEAQLNLAVVDRHQ